MKSMFTKINMIVFLMLVILGSAINIYAADVPEKNGETISGSKEVDTADSNDNDIFPLLRNELNLKERGRELPPAFGIMLITNWMDSDWEFKSASVSVNGSDPFDLQSAKNVTMDLQIQTTGFKADLWLFPFLDLMVGGGNVDVDATLGLRDIPVDVDIVGDPVTYGDAIVPMEFSGKYYSFGGVLAGAYKSFYAALDSSMIKTNLDGDASLSSSGFWTYTAAPKFGYNAGLSQIYVGARYISKNEHYKGTVPLSNGNTMEFDVKVKTASWVGNAGIRTVIAKHWEFLMEVAMGNRYQITAGAGYRW